MRFTLRQLEYFVAAAEEESIKLAAERIHISFQSVGLVANVYARSASPEVVRSMVAGGFGFTIANARPKTSMTLDGRRVTAVKLAGEHQPMRIGIATLQQDQKPVC